MFVWRAASKEGSWVCLWERAGTSACVTVLREPKRLDEVMMLSLRMPREWQKSIAASDWRMKPHSRIIQQYLFLVGRTERNMTCFSAVSWIAVVKMTTRTRADLCMACVYTHLYIRHPADNQVWATLWWRRREILPCWLYASSCCLLRVK